MPIAEATAYRVFIDRTVTASRSELHLAHNLHAGNDQSYDPLFPEFGESTFTELIHAQEAFTQGWLALAYARRSS